MTYADGKKLWALGRAAPGEMGSDTGTVLRSQDGGRHWRELGWTTTYPDYPLASFASVREGWIVPSDAAKMARLMFTSDGSTWRRLPHREFYDSLEAIQYLGQGRGFAVDVAWYSKNPHPTVFHQTSDGGRHWSEQRLPIGRLWVDRMRFANQRQGYIVGCLDQRLVALATSDAGHGWFKTELPVPPGDPRLGGCSLRIDGLLAVGQREVWMLGVKRDFGLNDTQGEVKVWRTTDGGHTWSETYQSHWTEDLGDPDPPGSIGSYLNAPAVAFSGPFALGHKLIMLFKDTSDGKGEALYTTDQGQHWSSVPLPHFITSCAQARLALVCSASAYPGFRLATLTLGS
jgi:photosystem II stability/assembly factor-like uncharacterized protein